MSSTTQQGGGIRKESPALSLSQEEYKSIAKKHEPKRKAFANCLRAFVVGGLICVLGQAIIEFFKAAFDMTAKEASNPTVAVLVLISVILTSLGVYDKMAQFSGAGTSVPVTGFANSMCSAALEHRSEGLVLGVGGNMFKVAGAVIVFGAVAAFIIGIIYAVLGVGGNHL
ncbi:stage V sporulation protein AC [Paenibacillus sp. JX-17]|uniref:Stage V sporulation protein AC n=1 Tax=Paenibacillus lacisoli TaxID=3064525 RepID=A0ABT9CC14_9BACL|nr:stage V sporulation protein AC [Paenibacillus sp. JX-17]MDO7905517.1 stage V sporulation protein AC [Paenibacillus sp. JX-17]